VTGLGLRRTKHARRGRLCESDLAATNVLASEKLVARPTHVAHAQQTRRTLNTNRCRAVRGPRSREVTFSAAILCAVSALLTIPLQGQAQTNRSDAQNVVLRGNARFEVLSPSVIRMEYSSDREFLNAASVAVLNRKWGPVQFRAIDSGTWLELSTQRIRLRYRVRSGKFASDNLLISWSDEEGEHHWKPGDKDDKNLGGVPGDIALRLAPGNEPGPLSRNGYFFLDDSHSAQWNSANDWVEPRREQNGQDWYFFVYGRDYKSLLHDLTQLLGPIPMVPRYIFGTWFGSRAGYSSYEWQRIIHRFREERVPLDIVTLDSDSTAKVIWAGRDWDLEQMPDPAGFFKFAKSEGVKVVVNEHYGALTPENCSNFERIRTAMGLPAGTTKIPHDLSNKKYAELYMDVLNKPALQAGMAFWWQDGNALANMRGIDPTLWTRYVEYAGAERITGKRAFDFERLDVPYQKTNATPAWGGHRYGGFFTGDLVADWRSLTLLVPFNVQAGNMLLAYVINDNPGFTPQVVGTELYDRSVQFNALSPVFWWHGIWGLRAPWEYGEASLENARKFLDLRYSLIPYLYTYSRVAHESGQPLVRGTYIEYPWQEGAYEFRQQYLLGKELLVAPITDPGFGEPVLKRVYLPDGEKWFDWFTGKIFDGGQTLAYECPLDRMPLFVNAGAILPLAPAMDHSDQRPLDSLTLEVFAGKSGSFRLYEDDGASLDYRNNQYAWTEFRYNISDSGEHSVIIGATQGEYASQPKMRAYVIRIHGLLKPAAVRLQNTILPQAQSSDSQSGWMWNQQTHVTTVNVPAESIRNQITVTLQEAGSLDAQKLLQHVLDYRSRLRQIEVAEKLKWGMLLHGEDIKKEPRVLRETEAVEQQLDDRVDIPRNLEKRGPDFQSWTASILSAFVFQPFESNRTIPEADEDAQRSTRAIANAVFTPEEINEMAAELLGCHLAAQATGKSSAEVIARLDYDAASVPAGASVNYAISFPEQDPRGWGEVSRAVDNRGFIHFATQAPFPIKPGTYSIRVKATLKWKAGQVEVSRDVHWRSES
jgi:alpha-glucosidase (family GH31 glycosyl hydrolase)